MDNRAIGVFDSGLGGLTAARVLEETLPNENIIYFGDTANMPYGVKSVETLRSLACRNAEFLRRFDVKAILVACGTVTSTAMDLLREKFDIPFFGVVDDAAKAAAEWTENCRVGVIATQASIGSGLFQRRIAECGNGLRVFAKACNSFVPLVESGHYRADDKLVRAAVEDELASLRRAEVDTLLLGCTHFPLLEEAISRYMGEDVKLVSCSAEAAKALARHLEGAGMLHERGGEGARRWFTSGDAAAFEKNASVFLGHGIKAESANF